MDWKRLVQFALQDGRNLEPYAILLVLRFESACSTPFPGRTNYLFPAARNLSTKRSFKPKFRFPVRRPIAFRVWSLFVDPWWP